MEESLEHLLVYCHGFYSLQRLPLSVTEVIWVQFPNVKDVSVSKRKENAKELDAWNLEVDFIDCLVKYMEGEKRVFQGKAMPLQDFKLYFF